jgi:hypothetical protein
MIFKRFLSWILQPKHLWVFVFVYTILIGLFVQFIALPHIFPSLHAGDGLIKGLDGTKFHRIALDLANSIKQNGWGQWELMPDKQLVSGIAAIFYVLIYPEPWTVLPVNALLNATAALCFYLIFLKITANKPLSLVATLPFLFFPSNLLWNAQFHNENYAVPGVILVLYGWAAILDQDKDHRKIIPKENILAICAIAFGTMLIGLVREEILSGFVWVFVAAVIVLIVISFIRRKSALRFVVPILTALLLMLVVNFALLGTGPDLTLALQPSTTQPSTTTTSESAASSSSTSTRTRNEWKETPGIPAVVDAQFKKIAKFRSKFIRAWDYAGSNIDSEVTFHNALDMIRYIPRAAEIGFLSPFPNLWFSEGEKETGRLTRFVSAFEMILVYVILLGVPVFLWRAQKKYAIWVILFVCTLMLITYAMTIPNVGSLYRFRYPYLMPIVGFGLAGWTWVLFEPKKEDPTGN